MRTPKWALVPVLVVLATAAPACSSPPKAASPSTSPPTTGAAVSTWKVSQSGSTARLGWLDGVDCLTATSCVAVGNESPANANTSALIETMQQGSWTATTAPTAPGSGGDYLFSVSCPSAGSCVAVGYYFTKTATGGSGTMLIDTLANGAWSVSPNPSLGTGVTDSFLNAVSCTSATSCVAVGDTDGGGSITTPLILTLANGAWRVTTGPNLATPGGSLLAVRCTNATACVAAGNQVTSQSVKTLVESLGAGGWSVVESPGSGAALPTYGTRGLNGLFCLTPTSCVAVGQLTGAGPTIETLTDQGWSTTSNPAAGSKDIASGLYGVSCTAPQTCVAVGDVAKTFGSNAPDGAFGAPFGTLIETETAGVWTLTSGPTGLPANSGLHAVSCTGKLCVAVGQSGQVDSSGSPTVRTLIVESRKLVAVP